MTIKCLYCLVPETGIEPVWPCGRGMILSSKNDRFPDGDLSRFVFIFNDLMCSEK